MGVVIGHSDNVFVVNNTLTRNVNHLDQPGAELNAVAASNVVFRNNLVTPNRIDGALMLYEVDNVTSDSNVYVASTPQQIGPDDKFLESLEFEAGSIPPAGSMTVDAGNSDGAPVIDILGNARQGRPDAGAIERQP